MASTAKNAVKSLRSGSSSWACLILRVSQALVSRWTFGGNVRTIGTCRAPTEITVEEYAACSCRTQFGALSSSRLSATADLCQQALHAIGLDQRGPCERLVAQPLHWITKKQRIVGLSVGDEEVAREDFMGVQLRFRA